ncbi:MAG: hypothetical protein LZT29_00726 [Pantoea stewartii]|nr:MAG: hypothetical protein LZT29_00726 [Pantoea stewartii]
MMDVTAVLYSIFALNAPVHHPAITRKKPCIVTIIND